MLGHVGVGAGEEDAPLGPVGGRRPHLLAGDHPLVAVAHGAGGDGGQVGAGLGLGEQLAPHLVAPEHRREEPPLLLLGAVGEQRGPDHADGDGEHAVRHAEARLLLVEDGALDRPAAAPAELVGQVMPAQPPPASTPCHSRQRFT